MSMRDEHLQEQLLTALLTHTGFAAAVAATGISERTALRFAADPVFKRRWQQIKRQRLLSSLDELQAAGPEAVATLRRNLTSGSASVEVRAATDILNYGLRAAELVDLAARIDELEQLWHVRTQS